MRPGALKCRKAMNVEAVQVKLVARQPARRDDAISFVLFKFAAPRKPATQ